MRLGTTVTDRLESSVSQRSSWPSRRRASISASQMEPRWSRGFVLEKSPWSGSSWLGMLRIATSFIKHSFLIPMALLWILRTPMAQ